MQRYFALCGVMIICLFFSVGSVLAEDYTASPEDETAIRGTLGAYVSAMETAEPYKALPYYSDRTYQMMKNRRVSDGVMRKEALDIKACGQGRLFVYGSLAVLRFSGEKRQCAPYFFVVQDDYWRLDLYTMMRVVRFDHKNQWWLDRKIETPYSFAFE